TTTFQYQLNPLVSLFTVANAQRYQTQQTPSQNYVLLGTRAGFAFRFPDPLFRSDQPWTISLSANLQVCHDDHPDPIVDPHAIPRQQDTIINLLLAVPFDDRTTFTLSLSRFNRAASLPNYEFANNSVMFGVSWRF